ncbi:MAG: nucleotidyltransferase domain-containing protein [Treponema sp.]|nr:nucleotidyltransferase domain-containing protein [Treponema sp.]
MINDEIREITKRFIHTLNPTKIILFGSYAKDTYTNDSDYDFYIILPDDTQYNLIDATGKAYHSLHDMHNRKSVDILVNTISKFNHRKKHPTLERVINREGVVLHG